MNESSERERKSRKSAVLIDTPGRKATEEEKRRSEEKIRQKKDSEGNKTQSTKDSEKQTVKMEYVHKTV
jgi:hypothetical protein